jgi:hypothetical protein
MKYTFECSDKEFIAVVGLANNIIHQIVKVSKVKAKAYRSMAGTSRVVESEVEKDSDGTQTSAKEATVHPFRVVKPTEEEIEDATINEPEPLPAEFVKKMKRLKKGEKAFCEFIHEWLAGVDLDTMELIPDATQPDRDLLLRATANGPGAYPILVFVAECGGLQRAIAKVTNNEDLAVRLARFIVPPASIAFPDLADQYEYTNPFIKDEDE